MARFEPHPTRPQLTVILPCAGAGSRLGLTFPKPLYQVHEGLRLIDLSLMHLRLASQAGFSFQVAVVVRPETRAVFDHVQASLPGIDVHSCPYNPVYPEWPGSVYSARSWFGAHNLVLLPDSIITLSGASHFHDDQGRCLVEAVVQGLGKHPVHLLYVPDTGDILRRMGAVHQENGELSRLADKPTGDLSLYNGYWVAYAFKADHGEPLYRYLEAAVSGQPAPFPLSRLGPPGAAPAYRYRDLGTWEAIETFGREYPDSEAFWSEMTTQAGMDVSPVNRWRIVQTRLPEKTMPSCAGDAGETDPSRPPRPD